MACLDLDRFTYYEILEISQSSTKDEIKSAYRKCIKKYHPDISTCDNEVALEITQKVIEAYSVLSDPEKRRTYDMKINIQQSRSSSGYNAYSDYSKSTNQHTNNTTHNSNTHDEESASNNSYNKNSRGKQQSFNLIKELFQIAKEKICITDIVILGIVLFFIICFTDTLNNYNNDTKYNTYNRATSDITPTQRPPHGTSINYTLNKELAPLKINLPYDNNDYLFILKNNNNKMVYKIFAHRNLTVDVNVPLGTYYLYYTCGNTWYGYNDMFGDTASFGKMSDALNFYRVSDGYMGQELTLTKQVNGNISSQSVSEKEFMEGIELHQ